MSQLYVVTCLNNQSHDLSASPTSSFPLLFQTVPATRIQLTLTLIQINLHQTKTRGVLNKKRIYATSTTSQLDFTLPKTTHKEEE